MTKFSVKKPMTVAVAVVIVLLLGFVSFSKMTTDLLPSMELPYAVVVTTYAGASPETVETVVTRPVEQRMATISNIKSINSVSSENMSMVILQFSDDANMDTVTIDMRESLDLLTAAWTDDMIGSPMIMKMNPDMLPIMVAAVDADGMTNSELSWYVNNEILPKLESVEGVASVSASGLLEEKVHVVVSQEKIEAVNETIRADVEKKLEEAQEELAKAEEDIERGKEELAAQKDELNEGMLQAEQQITDARLEIVKQEIELQKAEEEIAAKEAELEKGEREYAESEQKVTAGEQELAAQEKQIQSAEKQLAGGKQQLQTSKDQLAAQRSQAETAVAGIKANDTLSDEERKSALKPLEESLAKISAAEAELAKQEEELAVSENTAAAGRKELEAARTRLAQSREQLAAAGQQLKEGRTALEEGKAKLQSGKDAIAAAKEELNTQEAALNSQKLAASEGLTEAEKNLKDGEAQLNEQSGGFDEKKAEALAGADLKKTITAEMVGNLLKAQNFSMPSGYIMEEGLDYLVRVGDKIEDLDSLKSLVLFDPGIEGMKPVRLSDVAEVFMVDNSAENYAKVNGNDAIVLTMQKQNAYSTEEVTSLIKDKFAQISAGNPGVHATYLMDQGLYINMVVSSVLQNLIFGGILAVIILLFFLKDIRPTAIIACSIPISVIFAIVLMYFSGVTLNIISLSGLAVGVGMLVDNSVVVIENIYRLRNKGVSRIKAAVTGAVQVAGAIASSTLTTVCVFVPIVFVEGITRQLFMDMALTIAYSLLASLVVALTLVPAMSANMLKTIKEKKHPIMDALLKGYDKAIRFALRYKAVILIGSVAVLALSAFGAYKKGTAFMPEMDSTQISVSLEMPAEAVLADTAQMADTVMERIQTIPEVDTVGGMIGGGMSIMGMGGSSDGTSASIYVLLKEKGSKRTSQEIASEINTLCADLPAEVTASGTSMDMSALGGSGISLQIKGPELDRLQEISKDIAQIVSGVSGTAEVLDGNTDPAAEIRIHVDKESAVENGLTVAQVFSALSAELAGESASTTLEYGSVEYPVVVIDEKQKEFTREMLEDYTFTVTGQDGSKKEVKLKDIAEISDGEGFSSIRRSGQQRYVTVTAGIAEGHNIGLVSQDVDKALKSYDLPEGYTITSSGEDDTINEALFELVKMLLLAVAFIYLIMVAQFQSLLSPFIVMFTIPLAFTGGFLGLIISGQELSVVAMIGFVMLSGIVVNNGIVLVDYINQLRRDGMEKKEAIMEAGKTRMRPILMTALTTVLGLSTMAFGMGMGADMVQPIAIVTIGGLLYATLMTLFVVPVMYDILNKKKLKVVSEEELKVYEEL